MDWIKDCFKNLGSWILSIADKIIDFFTSIYNDVVEFFKYLADNVSKILNWFESFFNSFGDKVGSWFEEFVELLPDIQGYYNTIYQNYGKEIYLCNQWINLELAFNLLVIYIAVWSVFVTIKFTLKLIPTIG